MILYVSKMSFTCLDTEDSEKKSHFKRHSWSFNFGGPLHYFIQEHGNNYHRE